MKLWSRLVRPKVPPRAAGEENILIISDIHLGEDVLAQGPEHLSDYIRLLNRELAEFVHAHCQSRVDARRWHLVINGDMFDFVKVSLRPDPEEAYAHWQRHLSDEETSRLPNTPENVVWKLGRILEIHRPLFKELARFVLCGNRLTIIEGNHDAEFYFPEVQQTLREFLVREADKLVRREKLPAVPAEELRRAVCFRGWFESSPGRFHIEHGNQYDPYCSFEYNLAPLDKGGHTLATPMTHRAMPYFVNLLGDFSTHGIDRWGLGHWMRFVFNLGPRMLGILAWVYVVAMWQLLGRAGARRRAELEGLAAQHRERLQQLSHECAYGYETLEALDELKATPAEFSFFRMMHGFYLDRFILWLTVVLLVGAGAVWGGRGGWLLAAGALVGGGIFTWALAQLRKVHLDDTLRRAAARIADLSGARYVVFGHSHQPELVNLTERYGVSRFGERAFYINSGSWVTREVLLGGAGRGMTYVEISSHGAVLKRWMARGEAPVVLASTDRGPHPQPSASVEPAIAEVAPMAAAGSVSSH